MPNIPLQSLERGNFTDDSTADSSTRRVTLEEKIELLENNDSNSRQIISMLFEINRTLKKIEFHLSQGSEIDLEYDEFDEDK